MDYSNLKKKDLERETELKGLKDENKKLLDEISKSKEEVKTSVYNFEVEGVHSYTANGMMVHNGQDLSVAGKMKGLEGERSGLFYTAIRLVHELRRRTGKPRYFVWENVPGAFSSNKGLDFRAVLEEITKTENFLKDLLTLYS